MDEEDSDFVTFDAVDASASSGVTPGSLNFGPWSTEEHEAFMRGHEKHGNSWLLISQHYVPVRLIATSFPIVVCLICN